MKTLNVAVVGAGFMGKAHVVGYTNANKQFWPSEIKPVLKTICDIDEEIAKDAKERFGFKEYTTDWKDIINDPDIDIVSVCTPNNEHADISIEALEAGKHVLSEKPLARTPEDAKAIKEAAEKAAEKGVISMLGYQYRRVPALVHAKNMIDRGDIGEIQNIRAEYLQSWSADPNSPLSWRFSKETAGAGTLGDIATHVIDISQYLAGSNISDVVSNVKTYIKERPVQEGGADLLGTVKSDDSAEKAPVDVDDEVLFLTKYENGIVGSIEATRNAWGRNNYIFVEVHGSEGSIVFNYERLNELQVASANDPDGYRGFKTIYTGPATPYGEITWNIPGMNIGYGELKTIEINDFLLAIANGEQPSTSFPVGYQVDQVTSAVTRSNESNSWESVEK